jgi:hypothetical protein
MEALGWRRRRGSSPAARRGARQRAGLTPASSSNTLSCERETPHFIGKDSADQKSLDEDHGIYRDYGQPRSRSPTAELAQVPPAPKVNAAEKSPAEATARRQGSR